MVKENITDQILDTNIQRILRCSYYAEIHFTLVSESKEGFFSFGSNEEAQLIIESANEEYKAYISSRKVLLKILDAFSKARWNILDFHEEENETEETEERKSIYTLYQRYLLQRHHYRFPPFASRRERLGGKVDP